MITYEEVNATYSGPVKEISSSKIDKDELAIRAAVRKVNDAIENDSENIHYGDYSVSHIVGTHVTMVFID